MQVVPIPILADNYAYLLIDPATGDAAAVDPADPGPVLSEVRARGLRLTHVLCTHHHGDHSGGNVAIADALPHVAVVGPQVDAARIPGLTHGVGHGDVVQVGSLTVRVLFVPCHTRGHVAFVAGEGAHEGPALFCGDTLFVAGCGRFFEGSAEQMVTALFDVLGALPPETRVYCGHEYAVANLTFAATVEPENQAIHRKLAWAVAQRAAGLPTVPSTLAEEREYNPFLRVHVPALARGDTPAACMARLRDAKNAFRPA
ncbi:MAG: hydroxyacylglutathione hydrolase [Myxococcales bacterium]|nr:hydroxyacylglutathione hydrolase [Myxococcales bacterium]